MNLIRGLTLRHPWPAMFLLDAEPKRLENRDWPAPPGVIGQRIALHGGVLPKPGEKKYLREIRDALQWVNDKQHPDINDPVDAITDEQLLSEFCVSGIFGVARLVECVTASDDPWFAGAYGWVLADFVRIDPPVPHKGAQGLWEVKADVLPLLRERYRAAQAPRPQPTEPAPLLTVPQGDSARLNVLRRVDRHQPLNRDDRETVLALISEGLMHVSPTFDRSEVCPYRLTPAGVSALEGRP